VRIMPYRTLENRIDGVVITFMNISATGKMEVEGGKTPVDLGKRPERVQHDRPGSNPEIGGRRAKP